MFIETGIPRLDELLGGGIAEGSSVLFLSNPGIDSMIFLTQITYNSIQKEKNCLFYVDDFPPDELIRKLSEIKMWDLNKFSNLHYIDGFSAKTGIESKEKYIVEDAKSIVNIAATIDKAVRENKEDSLLMFKEFDKAFLAHGGNKSLELLDKVISNAINTQTTTFFSIVNWDFSKEFIEEVKKRFEYVVRLENVEDRSLTRNYFFVEKSPRKFLTSVVPFKTGLDGIGIYVPKVLITGPFHAGKSSFIHKVSTRAVSVDRMGTTVALDHGYIEHGGIAVDLFGTPGQERFEFMLDILKKDTFGIVLVVDSTDPKTFERGTEMLEHIRKEAIPFVIAANKKDIPGAISIIEIRKRMNLPEDVPIVATSAVTGEGCTDSVKKLIEMIIRK